MIVLAVASLVAVTGLAVVAAPVQAAPIVELSSASEYNPALNERVVEVVHTNVFMAPVDCPEYRYCVWMNRDWGGSMYMWNTGWNGSCVPLGYPFNDAVTSAANKMPGWTMQLTVNSGCGGGAAAAPMGYHGQLSWPYSGWYYNDAASSFSTY